MYAPIQFKEGHLLLEAHSKHPVKLHAPVLHMRRHDPWDDITQCTHFAFIEPCISPANISTLHFLENVRILLNATAVLELLGKEAPQSMFEIGSCEQKIKSRIVYLRGSKQWREMFCSGQTTEELWIKTPLWLNSRTVLIQAAYLEVKCGS